MSHRRDANISLSQSANVLHPQRGADISITEDLLEDIRVTNNAEYTGGIESMLSTDEIARIAEYIKIAGVEEMLGGSESGKNFIAEIFGAVENNIKRVQTASTVEQDLHMLFSTNNGFDPTPAEAKGIFGDIIAKKDAAKIARQAAKIQVAAKKAVRKVKKIAKKAAAKKGTKKTTKKGRNEPDDEAAVNNNNTDIFDDYAENLSIIEHIDGSADNNIFDLIEGSHDNSSAESLHKDSDSSDDSSSNSSSAENTSDNDISDNDTIEISGGEDSNDEIFVTYEDIEGLE